MRRGSDAAAKLDPPRRPPSTRSSPVPPADLWVTATLGGAEQWSRSRKPSSRLDGSVKQAVQCHEAREYAAEMMKTASWSTPMAQTEANKAYSPRSRMVKSMQIEDIAWRGLSQGRTRGVAPRLLQRAGQVSYRARRSPPTGARFPSCCRCDWCRCLCPPGRPPGRTRWGRARRSPVTTAWRCTRRRSFGSSGATQNS
jgi:hypothetical protein